MIAFLCPSPAWLKQLACKRALRPGLLQKSQTLSPMGSALCSLPCSCCCPGWLEKATRRGGSSGDFRRALNAGGAGALRTCSAAFRNGIGISTTESYLSNVFAREGTREMVSCRDRGRAIGLSETATLGGNVVGPMGLGRSLPILQGRIAPPPVPPAG